MRRALRATFVVVTVTLVLGGCGEVTDDEQPPGDTTVTSTSVPVTTTTVPPRSTAATTARSTTTAGATCLSVNLEGLALQRDYARDVRGIAGADEAAYKARARALAEKARRLGCQVPPGIANWPS